MLILAGVSLNATIGDNGIITRAQETNYAQSVAVLEEYFNQYYVEHYEELKDSENKAVSLKNNKNTSSWFYQGAPLGYVVDSDGNAHYFINKAGLPNEIKSQIVGGDAKGKSEDEITYQDYASMTDVYGVTSNLKVYYCRGGSDTLIGLAKEELDVADSTKEIFPAGSAMAKLATGDDGKPATLEDLKTKSTLIIDSTSGVTDLKDLYAFVGLKQLTLQNLNLSSLSGIENATMLNFIQFENCVIGDYTALNNMNTRLNTLYFISIDDTELGKICSKENGMAGVDFPNLQNFAIAGTNNNINSKNNNGWGSATKGTKSITSIENLKNFSLTTKKAIINITLQGNLITSIKPLEEFVNVELLNVAGNSLTTLDGTQNMSNLTYMYAITNSLGKNENEDTSSKDDALVSLENKTKLYILRLDGNTEIKWVHYLKNDTALRYLYLSNSTKMVGNSLVQIKNIIKICGNNAIIPSIYSLMLLDENTTILDLNGQTIAKNNFETLSSYTKIEKLNLAGLKLTGTEGANLSSTEINTTINNVISNFTNLKYLSLQNISAITSLDFLSNTKKLIELNLLGCGATNLSELNNITTMRQLLINNNSINLTTLQPTISRLSGVSNGLTVEAYRNCGLCLGGNATLINQLSNCTNITYLNYSFQNYYSSSNETVVLDLSRCTKLSTIIMNQAHLKSAIFPVNVITLNLYWSCGNGFINFPRLNGLINLKSINLNASYQLSAEEYQRVFDDLATCPQLNTISLTEYDNQTILPIMNLPNLSTLTITERTNLNINLDNLKNSNLPNLSSLTLTGFKTTNGDTDAFKNLTNLTTLNLSGSNFTKLKGLEGLTKLAELNLTNNSVFDTATYNDGSLNITYSNLAILANLNKTGALRKLYLAGNTGIMDWSPLSSINNWTEKTGW